MGMFDQNQYQDEFDTRDDFKNTGNKKDSYKSPLPEYTPSVDKLNRINIIPFKIGSRNHQAVIRGKAKIGDWHWVFSYFEHSGIGASRSSHVCLDATFGLECETCTQRWAARDRGDDKGEGMLREKRKSVYLVQDLNSDDPKQLRIFRVSYPLFTKEMDEEANACLNGAPPINYAEPGLDGKVVAFRGYMEKFGKGEYMKFKKFDFLDREPEDAVTQDVLDKALPIDKFLIVPTPDEVKQLFYGGAVGDVDYTQEQGTPAQSASYNMRSQATQEATQTGATGDQCPYGHAFGVDTDKYRKDCSQCKAYDLCNAKASDMPF